MASNIWGFFLVQTASLKRLPEWLRAWTTIVATICVVSLLACLLIICTLLVRLGVDALSASSSAYQETTRNFLLAFASAFGAPFLVWRAWVAHQQAQAAAEQARVALENHVTGIFAKSVELMGYEREKQVPQADGTTIVRTVPNIEARLGAIYSLERILRESEKDQRAILETLCAYVRENSPLEIPEDEKEATKFYRGEAPPRPTRRKDVQAAITVIGRRPERARDALDFKNANLVAYDFSGRNFDYADFSGAFMNAANLTSASLNRCVFSKTFMRSASLKDTSFSSSTFADCDVTDAEIERTNFQDATLRNTDLRTARVESLQLEGADLQYAFGYMLDYAVERTTNGEFSSYSFAEIRGVSDLIQKATYNTQTNVSQSVRDAILMMIEVQNGAAKQEGSSIDPTGVSKSPQTDVAP